MCKVVIFPISLKTYSWWKVLQHLQQYDVCMSLWVCIKKHGLVNLAFLLLESDDGRVNNHCGRKRKKLHSNATSKHLCICMHDMFRWAQAQEMIISIATEAVDHLSIPIPGEPLAILKWISFRSSLSTIVMTENWETVVECWFH